MFIRDIEPINNVGINLHQKENAEKVIDEIIEEPLKKACKIFFRKGIKTVMSSANKNNIVKEGEKPKKKEDILNHDSNKEQFLFDTSKLESVALCTGCTCYGNRLDVPTFEDAGIGYAWIMIDFDSLSNVNKEIILKLESIADANNKQIGEDMVWFVHPTKIGNIDYMMKTGKLDYSLVESVLDENVQFVEKVEVDNRYVEFERKSIILQYNNRYPINTVILRQAINQDTTVEEVESHFCKLAELFKSQKQQNINAKGKYQKDEER